MHNDLLPFKRLRRLGLVATLHRLLHQDHLRLVEDLLQVPKLKQAEVGDIRWQQSIVRLLKRRKGHLVADEVE